jgi:hypothetical protein
MTDLTKLTDDELLVLRARATSQQPQPADLSGLSNEELLALRDRAARQPQQPSWAMDSLKAFPAGVVRGVTGMAGLPGDIQGGMKAAQNWALRKVGLPETNMTPMLPFAPNQQLPTSADTLKAAEAVTGPLYQPQTRTGRYAETLGEFLPGALGPGGLARKAIGGVAIPALAAQTAYESAPEPYKNIAKVVGGVGGGFLGSLPVPTFGANARARNTLAQVMTPDSQRRLAELGPDAFLLEANPTTQQIAQGVVQRPGPAAENMRGAVTTRNEAAASRLQDDIRQNFGPPVAPQRVDQRITQAQRELDVPYRVATHNSQPVDVNPILKAIDTDIAGQAGTPRSVLQEIRSYFFNGNQTKNSAGELLAIRKAVDDLYNSPKYQSQTNTLRVIGEYRQAVDDAVRKSSPMVKGVDAKFEHLAKQRGALNQGQNILATGREAIRPSQLAQDVSKMTPHEQAALRMGARGEIDRVMGTAVHDINAARNMVKSDGKWNHQKLAQIFGQQEADKVMGALDRESAFRGTFNKLVANSETAPRIVAEDMTRLRGVGDMTPEAIAAAAGTIVTGNPAAAIPAVAITSATKRVADSMLAGGQKRLDTALANRLGLQGAERDAEILRLLMLKDKKPKNATRDFIVRALMGGTMASQ